MSDAKVTGRSAVAADEASNNARGRGRWAAGSDRQRALAILREETARRERGLTLVEWRAAYETQYGRQIGHLDSTATALVRSGSVKQVGGRVRSLMYAPAGVAVATPSEADLYTKIVDAVAAIVQETTCAASLTQVRTRLAAAGLATESDTLSWMLENLATESAKRATTDQCRAQLDRVAHKGANQTRERRYWRPAGTDAVPPEVEGPRSAVRQCVRAATEELGRPASPIEIELWLSAKGPEQLRIALESGTAQRRSLARRVRASLGKRGEIVRDYSAPWATDGGAPLRVAIGDVNANEALLARWTDAVYLLRPCDEIASTQRLREEAAAHELSALAAFAAVREDRFTGSVFDMMQWRASWPKSAKDWKALECATRSAYDRVLSWWTIATRSKVPRYARPSVGVLQAQSALQAIEPTREFLETQRIATGSRLRGLGEETIVGDIGMITAERGAVWCNAILAPLGRPVKTVGYLFASVRRHPNPAFGRGRLHEEGSPPFSLLDVGDVFAVLARRSEHGEIAVLLQAAVDLLGCVMRDAAALGRLLRDLPRGESYYRLGAAIAMAALGTVPPSDAVIIGDRDREGMNAFALAVGVSDLTPDSRVAIFRDATSAMSSDLREAIDEVTLRFAEGATIDAIY